MKTIKKYSFIIAFLLVLFIVVLYLILKPSPSAHYQTITNYASHPIDVYIQYITKNTNALIEDTAENILPGSKVTRRIKSDGCLTKKQAKVRNAQLGDRSEWQTLDLSKNSKGRDWKMSNEVYSKSTKIHYQNCINFMEIYETENGYSLAREINKKRL